MFNHNIEQRVERRNVGVVRCFLNRCLNRYSAVEDGGMCRQEKASFVCAVMVSVVRSRVEL